MTRRKHNEYLDISSSDEDENSGYDSGAAEEANFSRTTKVSLNRSKRQKLHVEPTFASDDLESEPDANLDLDPEAIQTESKNRLSPSPSAKQSQSQTQESISSPPLQPDPIPTSNQTPNVKSKSKPLTASSLAATNATAKKAGVLYLSRIPPFMRPSTVRSLLGVYGPITQIFLTPEPPSSYISRRVRGGNRKKSFIDGWVEFARKRHARVCADAINARTIGGRGGRFYGDDVWNARYLRGFAWGDLMADVRGEEREREERVRVGVGREVRERRAFLRLVEKSKIEETRRKKAEVRRGGNVGVDGHDDSTAPDPQLQLQNQHHSPSQPPFQMRFRQTRQITTNHAPTPTPTNLHPTNPNPTPNNPNPTSNNPNKSKNSKLSRRRRSHIDTSKNEEDGDGDGDLKRVLRKIF